jgi:hypothetical protein
MKNKPSASPATQIPASPSGPTYISATQLRADFPVILRDLQSRRTTVILCRWNKPAAILRDGTDSDGQPVIHFIPIQSRTGQQILRAARRSA